MNEKSNPMPMMYKTIPAVAELNKVPGFDPLKFLRHKVSRKTNEEMLQLELPYQKLWFRLRHPQGRMKLTTLRITEQLAIMEARVYLDRSDAEPISSYISQHSAEEGTDYVQAAQDEALSAALSDAGFGLQFADVAVDSTGKVFGSSIPLSGTAPIRQPMPNAAQRPVEAPGAALRQSGGEVHARPERAPQNAVRAVIRLLVRRLFRNLRQSRFRMNSPRFLRYSQLSNRWLQKRRRIWIHCLPAR